MKHICLQENNYDCGLACMKMMLAHYHKNKNFLKLDKEKINSSCSLLELKRIGERYNLFTEGVRLDIKDEIFNLNNSLIQLEYQGLSHFVIYERKTKNYVYLVDPKIGKIRLKIEEFLLQFTGVALIFKDVKPYQIVKEKKNKGDIKYFIFYISCLFLDFCLLILISYLGKDNYLFHNFLVVFCLVVLLFSKINIINTHMKQIDNNIIKILEKNIKLNVSTKQGLLNYKLYVVKYFYGLINTIFIILFLTFILFINGWYYLVIEVIIGIIMYIHSKLSLIKNNSIITEINNLESKFYKENDIENFNKLTDKSHFFLKRKSFTVVANQFIIVSLGIVLNNVFQINSFQYILFNSFYFLFLISQFKYLFNDNVSNRLEYNKYCSTYNYLIKKYCK